MVFFVLAATAGTSEAQDAKKPLRVLFIGNSYTQFHNLPRMVQKIAESAPEGPQLWVKKVTHNGATLRHQWNRGFAREAIERGNWDAVILQAHSLDPFDRPEQARDYAERFVRLIRSHGAKPLLFMPWPRRSGDALYRRIGAKRFDGPSDMLDKTRQYYTALGQELEVPVVPVGEAWFNALQQTRKPNLYMKDGTHPTQVGTFLSASLFYRALTSSELSDTNYRPWPMRKALARRLRQVATATPTRLSIVDSPELRNQLSPVGQGTPVPPMPQ